MNILYAASGEGMGHATRSHVVIEELKKKHNVIFFGGGKAYDYLKDKVKSYQTEYLSITYKRNKVRPILTVLNNVLKFPKLFMNYRNMKKICKNFSPDIIITDFEPLSSYYGLFNKKKVICIDNLHVISKTKIKYPWYQYANYLMSKITIRIMSPFAHHRIITAFYSPEIRKKNVEYATPILRKKIIDLNPETNNYYLVYQTSDSNKELIHNMLATDSNFIIYGFHKNEINNNLIFKKNNETEFFQDLKNAKGVIMNGGFTLMTESLYLNKPIFSIPVKLQFEQLLNALYLEKLGYGKYAKEFSIKEFNNFENNLDKYRKNILNYKDKPNDFINILNKHLKH